MNTKTPIERVYKILKYQKILEFFMFLKATQKMNSAMIYKITGWSED